MRLSLPKSMAKKTKRRLRIKARIRQKIMGTEECPRVAIFRSNNSFYAQCIDDLQHKTLVGLSSRKLPACKGKNNTQAALQLGKAFAKKLQDKGIKKIVFDRSGYLYHGRIKKFSEGLRESGIKH